MENCLNRISEPNMRNATFNHLNWKRKQIGAGWCSCLYTKKSGESWLDYFGFNSN